MRILFQALDVDIGTQRGDSVHTRNLAICLARAGHRIHLVAGASSGGGVLQGVDVTIRPDGGDRQIISHVRKVAVGFRPDVIYERRFSPKIAAAVSLLLGVPYVVEYNGIADEESAMQGRPVEMDFVRWFRAGIRTRLLRNAAGVVTVTPGLRDVVVRDYGVPSSRTWVVENGVDPTLFQPGDRHKARSFLGLGSKDIVCFVGNLVAWQGIDVLLDAMEPIAADTDLMIVGDGPERGRLETRAKILGIREFVQFVGAVQHSLIPSYIAASNLCVAPFSHQRNARLGVSALKLYEYLACGRPVVVTAIPGARELVEALGCGIVVPADDPTSLRAALVQAVHDSSFAQAATRASEAVRRDHSWERVANEVVRVLKAVTS